jgi:hypothetical protein
MPLPDLGDFEDDLDDWTPTPAETAPTAAVAAPAPGAPAASDPQQPARPMAFANPEQFVDHFLAPLIRRRLGGAHTWCTHWWAHAEAVLLITALWETWEHFRYEGALGMSIWLRDHLYPHLGILLSKDNGPFAACKPDRHVQMDPLPTTPAPAGMWAAVAFSNPQP